MLSDKILYSDFILNLKVGLKSRFFYLLLTYSKTDGREGPESCSFLYFVSWLYTPMGIVCRYKSYTNRGICNMCLYDKKGVLKLL